MNCEICRKPVVLVPSAAERAKKYRDRTAKEYERLFPTHTQCFLQKRTKETSDLMKRNHSRRSPWQIACM